MLIYGFKLVVIPFNSVQESESITNNHINLFQENEQQKNDKLNFQSTNKSSEPFEIQNKHVIKTHGVLSSYTIDLRKLDNWLEMRIIDIEFLYGYYEPTLFILCESNMTWVGRYAVKKDTCNSVALSLNLNQKTHPVIWPVDKLPSDCIKCFAVPAPIGGILIFAVNSLIYINQSVPSYAVSLNSLATRTSSYPFKTDLEYTKITLDSSNAVFIAQDRLCVSLKGGELYIITLITDSESLRSVQTFKIEKCANSVISTCLSKCFDNYLFVGSRLGNSVLLKYSNSLKNGKNLAMLNETGKSQSVTDTESISSKENEQMESNQIYNEFEKEGMDSESENMKFESQNNYSFEICDVLLNIAPCGYSIIGESVGDYSEYIKNDEFNQTKLNTIDLITSSGYTKNGAISVLQRSLRPDLIAKFQMQDIIDMWSVNTSVTNEEGIKNDEMSSNYLFLSKSDSTIILEIGYVISELDEDSCKFAMNEATLYCANTSSDNYIIQITTSFIYVYSAFQIMLEPTAQIYLVDSMDIVDCLTESPIKQAFVLDCLIGVLTENGSIFLYYFDTNLKK